MIRIFLTGKTSFIGRNLFEFLSHFPNKYYIFAPSHAELNLADENLVCNTLKNGKFDIIIHAAMYNKVFHSPEMLSESLRIFYNIEKCSCYYGKMYYFGSGAEFDKTKEIASITEEEFGRSIPDSNYGLAKYIMAKHSLNSKNVFNLRLFAVYGKYEDWQTKFISNAICRIILDKPVTISQNVVFDYMYIDDLCTIVEQLISISPKHQIYNVCSGTKIDLYNIAQKILNISGKKAEIIVSKDGLKPEYTASNNRLTQEINCEFTNLDKGISLLYDWYKNSGQVIDESKL